MRRRPRKLDSEERALWAQVAATLDARHRVLPAAPEPSSAAAPPEPTPRPSEPPPPAPVIRAFRIGEAAPPAALPQPPPRPAPRLDARALRALRRGKRLPDARIDLHGLTLAEAHVVLQSFLLDAHSRGARLVLVITGKGRTRADHAERPGALRREVPHWLARPPLARVVQEVLGAHQSHGGAGALYVWLRRRRD